MKSLMIEIVIPGMKTKIILSQIQLFMFVIEIDILSLDSEMKSLMTVIVSEIHPPYIEIDIQNLSLVIGMKIHPFEIQILMLVIDIMTFES